MFVIIYLVQREIKNAITSKIKKALVTPTKTRQEKRQGQNKDQIESILKGLEDRG